MNKLVNFVDQKLSPPLIKLGENRYMIAIFYNYWFDFHDFGAISLRRVSKIY